MTADRDDPPPSPCVSVCALDAGGGYCLGCFRTLDEIAAWPTLPARRQHAVLAAAERRMAAAFDGDG